MYNKLKRRLATIGLFIALASPLLVEPQYKGEFELLPDEPAFARCSCGTIYIGDKEFLKQFALEDRVILVEDERDSKKDPNMRIYNSCAITNPNDRNDVLEVLQEYERQNPSGWNRTLEAMRFEWLMHNISYDFSYQEHRTESVDLNNNDEGKYDNKILQRLLGVG